MGGGRDGREDSRENQSKLSVYESAIRKHVTLNTNFKK